jgi:hypothetical protein
MVLKSIKRLILSLDGAETGESKAGFRALFNSDQNKKNNKFQMSPFLKNHP